jgi:hypothetical protein
MGVYHLDKCIFHPVLFSPLFAIDTLSNQDLD